MRNKINVQEAKRIVGFGIMLSLLFAVFSPLALSAFSDSSATTFEDIENPSAEDLEAVSYPTVDDFNRLSSAEQQQYLLTEYNSEFAAVYVSKSDFVDDTDKIIAQNYFAEDPQNINNNQQKFMAYMKQEGVDITLAGPVSDYDEKGNLQGINQMINLNKFKNSPAAEDYTITVDPDGNLLLSLKVGTDFTKFSGTLESDKYGAFSMKQGSINGYAIKGATSLYFGEKGDISEGKVKEYGGIIFEEPTTIKTYYQGQSIEIQDAKILSVGEQTDLYVSGSADFADNEAVKGNLYIEKGDYFYVNNVLIRAQTADVALRVGEHSSDEGGEDYVRLTKNTITVNGRSALALFSAKDFVRGTTATEKPNIILGSSLGKAVASTDGERITLTGRAMTAQIGSEDNVYFTNEGKLYKEVYEGKSPLVDPNIVSQQGVESIGVPIDIVPEESGGVVFSEDDGVESLKEESNKPTVVGVALQGTELAKAYVTGDADAIQNRVDSISEDLKKGVGLTTEDQEFLVALYDGISAGGYVKEGPNAGTALHHYFTGNGEQLDVNPEMFQDSKITQDAMTDLEREVERQKALGKSSGKIDSVSCGCLERRAEPGYGKTYSDGVVSTNPGDDPDLFYTDHNFYLAANYEENPDGTTKIVWTVDDIYDFKRTLANQEVIRVPVAFSDKDIIINDGIAHAMATDLDLAKPFNVHAEWETTE